jgi:chromosome partitioning protein
VSSEISRLKREHDYIIIDSPPHTEADAKTAIREADLVLLPVQPSPTDLWATQATLKLAKDERKLAKVVLNRVSPNSKLAQMALETLGQDEVLENMLGNRVLFASALMEGRTATETSPSHVAAQEVKALAQEVLALVSADEDEAEMVNG